MLFLRKDTTTALKRYLLLSADGVVLFSLGLSTLKALGLDKKLKLFLRAAKKDFPLPPQYDLEKLRSSEENSLIAESYLYLSKAERSPSQFCFWLRRRGVKPADTKRYLRLAQQQNFLSLPRFALSFVSARKQQANKPWRKVERELEAHGISKTVSVAFRFSNAEVLQKKYSTFFNGLVCLPASAREEKQQALVKKLLRQGFLWEEVSALFAFFNSPLKG